MNISKSTNGNEATIILGGWLDTQAANDFQNSIASLEPNIEKLIIDMKKLEYISSSGMRQIVAAHKKMKGNIVLMDVPESILGVLRSIGMDKKVNIENSEN